MRIQNHSPTATVSVDEIAAALTAYYRVKLDDRKVGNLRSSELQSRQLVGSTQPCWVGEFTFELKTESK